MQATARDLNKVAIPAESVVKEMANIGGIGIAPDYSRNTLRNPVQDENPLVSWLLSTSASQEARSAANSGLAPIRKNAEGKWVLAMPYSVYTTVPADTTGSCCWIPPDIGFCGDEVPLNLLCLKDCEDLMDRLINQGRRAGSNDLTGFWQRQGESVKDAKSRWAREWMAWLTARNMILGTSDTETGTLKPFHGLIEVVEDPSVFEVFGTNVLGAFATILCRRAILGAGNSIFAVHPLTYMGIDAVVQPGKFGTLPAGWSRSGTDLRFNGIPFVVDKKVPVDLTAGTGEAWLLDGDVTGAFMGTGLRPGADFTRLGEFISSDDPANGCATECDLYYNYGTVFCSNPNRNARIVNIPLSADCIGTALQGLDDLVQPETMVPR